MRSVNLERCQLCVSLGESHFLTLLKQIERAAQWADLIEIRLDKLTHFDIELIPLIEERSICPLIWTLRKFSQGGDFKGSEGEYFNILHSILSRSQPSFVDLEADVSESVIHDLQKFSPKTKWIISWHQLAENCVRLEDLYQTVSRFPATYYKIVTFARSTTDAIRMLNFTRKINQNKSHLCGLCMGELGIPTRVLAPLAGQPLTFTSLEKGKETASGQLTAEELLMTYRFREINKKTKLFGLIGRPISNSFSHLTHNAVFRDLSVNAVYIKFYLQDEELFSFFSEIESLPIKGISVTMPFKEKVLSLLHDSKLMACNTLIKSFKGWKGFNTDGIGALRALGLSSLDKQRIVILGAGGTAKAIAWAAYQQGAQLAILNRTLEHAKHIATPLKARWGLLEKLPSLIREGYKCLIQATSVGMAPKTEEMLIPVDWLVEDILMLDVVSNPIETRLLREVKSKGGKAISGQELFIHQAIEQFICWFGPKTCRKRVENSIRQYLPKMKSHRSIKVRKSSLAGEVSLPPSKSHTIRAILLAAFAKGTSFLHHLLDSPDTANAIEVACQFGAKVCPTSTGLMIQGVAGLPHIPSNVIDAGNSGQVLRFAAALAALSDGYTVITGDDSIRFNRPIQALLDGLKGLNVWAVSTRENGYAPLIIKGPLKTGSTCLEGQDSQPVSALLMAAAFSEGQTEIRVQNVGEKPWLALTLSWLDRLGVSYTHQNLEHFIIQGQRIRPAFEIKIPGDLSSLAFPLAAALVTKSELIIQYVDLQDIQGDKALVFLLQQMGACLEVNYSLCCLKVLPTDKLKGKVIDANSFIDSVPILSVLGCFAEGETEIYNVSIARQKESNRLACITSELKKMGAFIEETQDGLKIKQSQLKGACVNSYGDHRIAMSLIIAGLGAAGETEVCGIECIAKSYPTFLKDLKKIGARLDESPLQNLDFNRISN